MESSDGEVWDASLTFNLLRLKDDSEIHSTHNLQPTLAWDAFSCPAPPKVNLSLKAVPFQFETSQPTPKPAKRSFTLDLVAIASGGDCRTTVMIKNIPNKYTQKMLLERLDEKH